MANPYLLIRQGTQDFGNVLQQGAAGQRALLNLKAEDAIMERDRQNKLEYLRQQSQYAADLDLMKRQRDMQMQQAAQIEMMKAQAAASKDTAQAQKTMAEVDETIADTQKTQVETQQMIVGLR